MLKQQTVFEKKMATSNNNSKSENHYFICLLNSTVSLQNIQRRMA